MKTDMARELFSSYLHRRYGDRSTPKHYLSDLDIFLAHLGDKPITEVNAKDIDEFVDQQHVHGLAPATINRRLASLRTFFECLAAQAPDEPWPNPVNWRRHGVKSGKALPRDALDAEVAQLFAVIHDVRDAAMFGLMVGAGLRVSEVVDLRIGDLAQVNLADQLVRLRVKGKGHKERMVWLTATWYARVQAWLAKRPLAPDDHLFLNQHKRKLTKDGVQFRLKHYCEQAGLALSCHQLRHTFARRLAEQRMPIESISQLLGHSFVATTQRYTNGANPDLRDEFQRAMAKLDNQKGGQAPSQQTPTLQRPPRQVEKANVSKLEEGLKRYDAFPAWLREELCAYTHYRWRSWKAQLAVKHLTRLTCQLANTWKRLFILREIGGWADLQRTDIEAWLDMRRQAGLIPRSLYTELGDLRAFLQFVTNREHPVNANVFRVAEPVCAPAPPKHLTEAEYERLLKTVLSQTADGTLTMVAERAWFLTLAHTGLRVNELLDIRLADLDLAGGRILVSSAKNGQDRVIYLTPALSTVLNHYLTLRPGADDDHLWRYEGRVVTDEQIRARLTRWGKQCDVVVTPHRLRHTFATRLLNQGVSLEVVRKLLGHSSLQMSQHYARLYDSTVKAQFESAAAKLEGIAIRNWPMPATTPLLTQTDVKKSDSV